jgi:hypothetical protein
MTHEVGNVFEPLAKRRQSERDDVEPVEQILPEQMILTLVRIGVRPPTVVYSPSCSTRKSRVCASIGISPISSRKSVPPSACSKRPTWRVWAPVKAPFS